MDKHPGTADNSNKSYLFGTDNFNCNIPAVMPVVHNYVYKHVHIYFLAAGQAIAVGSLESGNLVVYRPFGAFLSREIEVKDSK